LNPKQPQAFVPVARSGNDGKAATRPAPPRPTVARRLAALNSTFDTRGGTGVFGRGSMPGKSYFLHGLK